MMDALLNMADGANPETVMVALCDTQERCDHLGKIGGAAVNLISTQLSATLTAIRCLLDVERDVKVKPRLIFHHGYEVMALTPQMLKNR